MRKTVMAAFLLAIGCLAVGGQETKQEEIPEKDIATICAYFETNPLKVGKEIGTRWLRVKDKVSRVVVPEQKGAVKLILVNRTDSSPSVIECLFDPSQFDALKSLEKGAVVRLRGKLDRFNQSTIYLKNCELIAADKK
jgi:hypothetical protein